MSQTMEALSSASETAIDKMTQWLEVAGQFAAEQTPLLVNEILKYNLVENVVWLLVSLAVAAAGVYSLRWWGKVLSYLKEDTGIFYALWLVASLVIFGVSLNAALSYFMTIFQIILAPRLYLLEEFVQLVAT